MRPRTRAAAAVGMLTLTVVAFGAATWSPITCGCVDGWANLYELIGQQGKPDELTADRVQQGLVKTYRGKTVTAEQFNNVNASHECAYAANADNQIICTWYIWQAKSKARDGTFDTRFRGFHATFDRDPKGVMRNVRVVEVETPRS